MKSRYFIIPSMVLSLLSGCNSKKQNNNNQQDPNDLTERLDNSNLFHYFGRHAFNNGKARFAFSGTGFEIKLNVLKETNSVTFKIDSSSTQYVYIYIDGEEPKEKLKLTSDVKTYELTKDLTVGTHYLRFVKLDEVSSSITLDSFSLVGCSIAKYDIKYEKRIGFYGDSITCGYGTDGTRNDKFSPEVENYAHSYAYQCAKELNYDYSTVSRSGISVCMNYWDEQYYFKDLYETLDGSNKYDIKNDAVDIAVIALGTNDNTKFVTYTAEEQKTKADELYRNYVSIAERIRTVNPKTQFFFAYNMMLSQNGLITLSMQGAVNYLKNNYGDNTAYLFELTPNSSGVDAHPGGEASMNHGEEIAEFIKNPIDL